jgi:hypothetical protein
VMLTADGLVDANPPTAQTTYSWRTVRRVVRHEAHLFLYVAYNKAVIVPQRAFASTAEFDAFASAAERYREAAVAHGA